MSYDHQVTTRSRSLWRHLTTQRKRGGHHQRWRETSRRLVTLLTVTRHVDVTNTPSTNRPQTLAAQIAALLTVSTHPAAADALALLHTLSQPITTPLDQDE